LTSKVQTVSLLFADKGWSVEGACAGRPTDEHGLGGRGAEFHSKAPANMIAKVRQYIAVLLQIPVK